MKKVTGHSSSKPGNWLMSKRIDLVLLFAPVWILWLVFFTNSSYFQNIELPLWAWVVFILGLDVSHVWSSLFRTYFEKDEFKAQKKLLIITPVLALVISIAIISISMGMFWRIMAYLAVFHFIKQQYGFAALYKLKAREKRKQRISDKLVIYVATIYPIVFWHFNSESNFNWFMENDFFNLYQLIPYPTALAFIFYVLNIGYWVLIGLWLLQEIVAKRNGQPVSIGKLFWVVTTAINWWFAIVFYNSDTIFSISNVVAHGIPYLALIYYYKLKKEEVIIEKKPKTGWKLRWLILLVITVLVAAIVEEYFWDMLVYREHGAFFETILPYHWNQVSDHWLVVFAVAVLALPQQVHYVIDGFIWKMNKKNKYLKPVFKPSDES